MQYLNHIVATGIPGRDVDLGGNETLSGTGASEQLGGGRGNDVVSGNGGNDIVVGGNDRVSGGSGNDKVIGGVECASVHSATIGSTFERFSFFMIAPTHIHR